MPIHKDVKATRDTSPKLTGMRCRCSGCGEYFNSVSVFDQHRTGDATMRRCLTVDDMMAKRWSVNAAGFWIRPSGTVRVVSDQLSSGPYSVRRTAQ